MEQKPIVARFILEIFGAPKEHIIKALRDHMNKVKEDYDVHYEKYAEPIPKETLFTQFVEIEVAFKDAQQLLDFCFDNMPSSIEIIKPDALSIPVKELEDVLNDFSAKIHHTDAMITNLSAQKQVLDRNTVNIFHNFIKYACATKPHTIADLSKLLGIDSNDLTQFVEHLVKKGIIKKEGTTYTTHG
ncbi:hypothetical protein J4211_03960 [Candidatus Woesearchaeota archaeon]|nr:hypothetical protein [Candidatus Woesearchaeota archaeon]